MDLDGRPIGELKASALVEWGNTSHEAVQASMRERRRAARGVKRYISSLSYGVESELDAMRRTNPLPAHVQVEAIIPAVKQLAAAVGNSRPLYAEDIADRAKARAAAQKRG
jgi:sRNA-binding protein